MDKAENETLACKQPMHPVALIAEFRVLAPQQDVPAVSHGSAVFASDSSSSRGEFYCAIFVRVRWRTQLACWLRPQARRRCWPAGAICW